MDSNNNKHYTICADGVIHRHPNQETLRREMTPEDRLEHIYDKRALDIIEDRINLLGSLVASGDDMIERFSGAVADFKKELRESEQIPQELAKRFIAYDYPWGSNQQAFVDDLKRELKLCRVTKFYGPRDTLKQTVNKNPILGDALQFLRQRNMNK